MQAYNNSRRGRESKLTKRIDANGPFRKSVDVSISQPVKGRRMLKRARYEEEDISPYLVPTSNSHKMKSGQLRQFYRQPRSSLSQHHELETTLHQRKSSLYELDQAREQYQAGNYARSIQLLRRRGTDSPQGIYLLAMSLINSKELQEGANLLLKLIDCAPTFKKSVFIVAALALKKLNRIEEAISTLSKSIELHPTYDCYVYRAKLYMKQGQFQGALDDFNKAVAQNEEKGFALLGKAICEDELGEKEASLRTLSRGIKTQLAHLCHERKGVILYQLGRAGQASRHLDAAIKHSASSTSYYFKGMILYEGGERVAALLSFEEALRCDSHRAHLTLAFQMMLKMKIEEKDFYQAHHILMRVQSADIEGEAVRDWRLFLEGSLFLMKKKYREGIEAYTLLLKGLKDEKRGAFLRPLIHLYRAFGSLNEHKTQQTKQDYLAYDKLSQESNLSKEYNSLIMEAYEGFPKSKPALLAAINLIPSKPQPYLLLAFTLVRQSVEAIPQAIETLSIGIAQLPQLSNNHISTFFYFRSLLHLQQGDFGKAIADVDRAIEKSEDNIVRYFHLRGVIFACFGNFSQAVQDLSVAINLDGNFAKSYLQRAKCLQVEGSSNEAFLDLQRYITLAPDDDQIHKYAGFLLFQNCAYQDCLAAFCHGAAPDSQVTLTKAKCHFLLAEYEEALTLLKGFPQYEADGILISLCKDIRPDSPREDLRSHLPQVKRLLERAAQDTIFKKRDMHQIAGSIHLLLLEIEEAIHHFQCTLTLFNEEKKKEMEKNFVQDSQQFEDEWSEVEIKFNLSLCYLAKKQYGKARAILQEFQSCAEKGKLWNKYMQLLDSLEKGVSPSQMAQLDTFQQNHRISRDWPKLQLPFLKTKLGLAFSYPFVQPPQLLPTFDEALLEELDPSTTQSKPQAPWINRGAQGLVFTPNVQPCDNLELSVTTLHDSAQHQASQASQDLSEMHLQADDLKKKFKLDSATEMKLNKIMNK